MNDVSGETLLKCVQVRHGIYTADRVRRATLLAALACLGRVSRVSPSSSLACAASRSSPLVFLTAGMLERGNGFLRLNKLKIARNSHCEHPYPSSPSYDLTGLKRE